MQTIKHVSAALIALGLSAPALAQLTDVVCIPNQHAGVKVSVEMPYLRENSLNSYVDASYDLGANLQVGYLFPNTGNDITLNYMYLRSDADGNSQDTKNQVLFKGTQEADLDTIDLELGQRLIAHCLDMRLFAGVRYTEIGHELGLNVSGPKSNDALSFDTTFTGTGPRMGVDARYCMAPGFGLDAHLNSALLVGKIKSTYQQNNDFTVKHSQNSVIPTMDAKIGVDFSAPFQDKSCLIVEVGYQASHYFNVIDNSTLNGGGDASFNGAYLDIKYLS